MASTPELSVVIPVFNEIDNLDRLCEELAGALGAFAFEAVMVDDGSTDGSLDRYPALQERHSWLRVVRHPRNSGQSAAICTGARVASAPLLATIDGDLQNDPADIAKLLEVWREQPADGHVLVVGNRVNRRDTWLRRFSSRLANRVRSVVLKDNCMDTGCSLKIFRRDDFMVMPQFDHMHRFLPALFVREGMRVINVPVNHRPRTAGKSKYGVGNRLWVGIVDLLGTRWLLKRRFRMTAVERLKLGDE
ncbi:MAG: glycosyltransferase family 2 protein [Xanthomonadales bacterium]|nr:glycosyltransferase family 2 protein [Xanthomonadales bacterium]